MLEKLYAQRVWEIFRYNLFLSVSHSQFTFQSSIQIASERDFLRSFLFDDQFSAGVFIR